jgi:hypothetical protein
MAQTKIKAGGFDADVITGTTALTATPADTDEVIISDAGTLKRIDFSLIHGNFFASTGFSAYINTTQTITSGTETVLPFDTERYDLGSAFDTSAYTYTPPSNGYYMFSFGVSFRGGADDNLERCNVGMKKASSTYQDWEKDFSASYVLNANTSATIFANVSDSDAYKVYVNITDQSGNPQVLGTITNSYFEGCRIA